MGKMLDMPYIMEQLVKLCTTPSPTGDTEQIVNYLQGEFERLGLACHRTNKGGLLATLPGKDDERQRVLSGHVDTPVSYTHLDVYKRQGRTLALYEKPLSICCRVASQPANLNAMCLRSSTSIERFPAYSTIPCEIRTAGSLVK